MARRAISFRMICPGILWAQTIAATNLAVMRRHGRALVRAVPPGGGAFRRLAGGAPALILSLVLGAGMARAQEVNCAAPVTQQDMNSCAERAWRLADEDLNLAYGMARTLMQQTDAALPAGDRGAEAALRDAQRAWIAFRDTACRAEGYVYFGGSIRPLVVSQCLERMTRTRTEELRSFAEPH